MAAEMMPWAGSMPRRARYLIPRELPRRGEVIAVCAVAILVAHLLLAQLTLVLAVMFAVVSRASRWRRWWLLAPAGAGLAWTLTVGPGNALAGFAAGPSAILWQLSAGHLAGRIGHPLAGFGDGRSWLPGQFPVALLGGAAEAALIGWLDWLHTDEWAVPPPRPGVVAAVRRALAARAVRAGTVVTREGAALGITPATGAVAELRWTEATRGTLIVGAAARDVTLAGLQVVHAALRRRKPVIVLDPGDAAVARALHAACAATGTPLLADGPPGSAPVAWLAAVGPVGAHTVGADTVGADTGVTDTGAGSASRLWGRAPASERQRGDRAAGEAGVVGEVGRVVRERSAALLPADTTELAAGACAELVSVARDLRRIGVDGDALVWVPRGERVPAQALAELVRSGQDAGVSVVIGTTSPAAATELGKLTGTALIYRVADPDLAACLAPRAGTRLLPRSLAAVLAGQPGDTGARPAGPERGDPGSPGAPASLTAPASPMAAAVPRVASASPMAAAAAAADLVPSPVIAARTLLSLGPAEFVLAVSWPRQRLIAPGRMVPARLPRGAPPSTGRGTGDGAGRRPGRPGAP